MAKLNEAARTRLMQQRTDLEKSGGGGNSKFIHMEDGDRIVVRILPAGPDGLPGVPIVEAFSRKLNKGAVSPATFGGACPISDYLDKAYKSLTKDEFKDLKTAMRVGTKYTVAVIDREDPGTTEAPIFKLLSLNQKTYDAVLMYMLDGETDDITDLIEGRDVSIRREGKDTDTVYHLKFEDRSALSDDEEYMTAVRTMLETYSIQDQFYRVDWQRLGELYRAGTGEEIPATYMEGAEEYTREAKEEKPAPSRPIQAARPVPAKPAPAKPAAAAPAKPAATAPARPAPKPAPKPAPAPPAEDQPDGNGVVLNKTRARFNDGEKDVEGVITAWNGEQGNGDQYEVKLDDGSEWNVDIPDLTILEDEPAPAPAPAPRPKPSPKAPAKPQPASAAGRLAAKRP